MIRNLQRRFLISSDLDTLDDDDNSHKKSSLGKRRNDTGEGPNQKKKRNYSSRKKKTGEVMSVEDCAQSFPPPHREGVLKVLSKSTEDYPPFAFVWNEIGGLVQACQVPNNYLDNPPNGIDPCPLVGHLIGIPRPVSVDDFKTAIMLYVRASLETTPPPPMHLGVLTLSAPQATQAAGVLAGLCAHSWFVDVVDRTQQELPLARVVIPITRSNGMSLVLPTGLGAPTNLWS